MSAPHLRRRLPGVAAALAAAAAGACAPRPDVEVVRAVPSPDGTLVARYYRLSGGGGAGYVDELVDVRPRTARFDPRDGRYAFGMTHAGGATLAWDGPRRLRVAYPGWADVFRRCAAAGGARLAYVRRAAPDSAWGAFARAEYAQHGAVPGPPRRGPLTGGCA